MYGPVKVACYSSFQSLWRVFLSLLNDWKFDRIGLLLIRIFSEFRPAIFAKLLNFKFSRFECFSRLPVVAELKYFVSCRWYQNISVI